MTPTDASVLILGESGTGKELIARAIHDRSKRSTRALVKVNCASVPHELFESEFFGHVKGVFTGAVRDRVGRFQLADGGTLKQLLALERRSIQEALQMSGGKIYGPGGAAELLGLRPTTLSSKIAALGIKRRQPLG